MVGLAGEPCISNYTLLLKTIIACRTNSFSIVIGIRVGLAADQPFHQRASVLLSDQALRFFFIFRSDVMFLLSLMSLIVGTR